MTPADVIKQVQENASEWLEMTENPAELLTGILANKIVELMNHVKYLEKRLEHDSSRKVRVN